MKKILLTSLIVMGLSSANACSDLSNWSIQEGGIGTVEAPESRLEGLCSLKATAAGDFVAADLEGASTDTYIRFYVLHTSAPSDSAKIVSLDDGELELEGSISANGFSFGSSEVVALEANKWNLIQLHVTPNKTEIWVNDLENVAASVQTGLEVAPTGLTLGGISGGVSGNMYFDSVVVKSGEVINDESIALDKEGTIIPGDANGSASAPLTMGDVGMIIREVRKKGYSNGVPDANLDGRITMADVGKVIRTVRGIE